MHDTSAHHIAHDMPEFDEAMRKLVKAPKVAERKVQSKKKEKKPKHG